MAEHAKYREARKERPNPIDIFHVRSHSNDDLELESIFIPVLLRSIKNQFPKECDGVLLKRNEKKTKDPKVDNTRMFKVEIENPHPAVCQKV